MAEPHIASSQALDGISTDNNLDTGPTAYHAQWSADSRRVAVAFRSERHVAELNLYAIEGHRAHLVSGPSLYQEVTGRDVGPRTICGQSPGDHLARAPAFPARERRLFLTSDAGFGRGLGAYGKATEKGETGKSRSNSRPNGLCGVRPSPLPHRRSAGGKIPRYCRLRNGSCKAPGQTGGIDEKVHRRFACFLIVHHRRPMRKLAVAADQGDHSFRRRQRRRCGAAAVLRPPRGGAGPADRDREPVGAGGTLGTGMVAKADPDGYSILANSTALTITPAIFDNLTYDVARILRRC